MTCTPEQKAASNRRIYAARLAAGTCVKCGGERSDGDRLFCAPCREKYRARMRRRSRNQVVRSVRNIAHECQHPSDADLFLPHRRLVCCLTCCDLAHRRPATGCPECGGRWAPLPTARAYECASAREHRGAGW